MPVGLGDRTRQNVIGSLPGEQPANERILLSAHVDSLENCSGADDNASGVAGIDSAAATSSRETIDYDFAAHVTAAAVRTVSSALDN